MYNNFNTFGMFGIGNLFGGVCNTYTNYYGTGFGGCGCGSIFDYKSMAGLAVGTTLAPILGVLTYKGVSSMVQNKKDNSVDTLDSQIREQLVILGIDDGNENAAKDVKIQDSEEAKVKSAADGKVAELSPKLEPAKKAMDDAKRKYEDYANSSENQKLDNYKEVCAQLKEIAVDKKAEYDRINSELEKAKDDQKTAQAAYDKREKEISDAKSTLKSLIDKRNEKLFDDADGRSMFRTSKDDLDKIIKNDDGTLKDVSNIKVTKANLKSALHAYTKASTEEEKATYKEAFIKLYDSYDERKCKVPIGSDLKAAYDLLKSEA